MAYPGVCNLRGVAQFLPEASKILENMGHDTNIAVTTSATSLLIFLTAMYLFQVSHYLQFLSADSPHHTQTDLNKKSGAMHQNLISFNIDAQGFR